MRTVLLGVILLSFCWFVARSKAWAQDDLFTVPSPTPPSFFTDHSYDNQDVDGTALSKSKNSDSDSQEDNDSKKRSTQSKSKNDRGDPTPTPTETDINGL